MENNLVYVGEGRNFPGLFRKALKIDNLKFTGFVKIYALKRRIYGSFMRIRYRQPLEKNALSV